MSQNIIVAIVLILAFAYVSYSVVKIIRSKNSSHCGDCCGCSAKQDIMDMTKKKNCC